MEHKILNFTNGANLHNADRCMGCKSRLCLINTLIFLLFAALALCATAAIAEPVDRHKQKKDAMLRKLTEHIQLSDDQQDRARDILNKKYRPQDCEELTNWRLRKECGKSLQVEFDTEFIALLSERQKELYDDMRNPRKSALVRGISKKLDLSPTQRKTVREIISRNQELCKNMDHRQMKECRRAIKQKTTVDISEILDHEQRDTLDDLVKIKSPALRY